MFAGNPKNTLVLALLLCWLNGPCLKLHHSTRASSASPPDADACPIVPYAVVLPDPPLAWLWCVAVASCAVVVGLASSPCGVVVGVGFNPTYPPCGVVCCCGGLWVSGLVLKPLPLPVVWWWVLGLGFAPAILCGTVVGFGSLFPPLPPVVWCGGGLWVSSSVFNSLPPSLWRGGGCWV